MQPELWASEKLAPASTAKAEDKDTASSCKVRAKGSTNPNGVADPNCVSP